MVTTVSPEYVRFHVLSGNRLLGLTALAEMNRQSSLSKDPKWFVDREDLELLLRSGAKVTVEPHTQTVSPALTWVMEVEFEGYIFIHNSPYRIRRPHALRLIT